MAQDSPCSVKENKIDNKKLAHCYEKRCASSFMWINPLLRLPEFLLLRGILVRY